MTTNTLDRLTVARVFYGARFKSVVAHYIGVGVVVVTPNLFLLAEPRCYYLGGWDTWFIEYLSGDIATALAVMPFWLPYIGFERRGRLKIYATATLINHVLADEPVQNGSPDPLPRRWWRGEDQAAPTPHAD